MPVVYELLNDIGEVAALIKPQFEAGREKVGKKGVVRDPKVHMEVIKNTVMFAAGAGFVPDGLDFSPVKGPEGNIEYLLHLKKEKVAFNGFEDTDIQSWDKLIADTVENSHKELDK